MASGDTKTEAMLNVLGNGGSGDEFRGCCNTKTQQYILDAIDRINNIQPGGSYEAGTGIEIADDTISVDTETIQPKLTAGTNITIDSDNVISATGGSITPVQTTGTSTTDVMSQDATTKMVFGDGSDRSKIRIGRWSDASGSNSIAIGGNATYTFAAMAAAQDDIAIGNSSKASYDGSGVAQTQETSAIAIGSSARAGKKGSIALGMGASTSSTGEMNIGTSNTSFGYNNSNYRLLTGLYDPQSAHDASTKGYVDGLVGNIASALNAINNGTGA